MKTGNLKVGLGLAAVVLTIVGLAGCHSDPEGTPVNQRKPGEDISSEARTDKRGDVPVATPGNAGK